MSKQPADSTRARYHAVPGAAPESEPRLDLLAWAEALCAEGHAVALATVVQTWGSSPRPLGSQLVVVDDGRFEGSVSGGCVEGRVIERARVVMESGAPELLEFGVSNPEAWELGLPCGGRIGVWVEPVEAA